MCNMSRLGLKEEEQVAVSLRPLVVGKQPQLYIVVVQMCRDLVLLDDKSVKRSSLCMHHKADLFQTQSVLNQQGYPSVQISYVLFQDEVPLRLRRDLRLEIAQRFLGYYLVSPATLGYLPSSIPLARSSSTSSSLSFALIERYSAPREYRFDWRVDLEPSREDIVPWREGA